MDRETWKIAQHFITYFSEKGFASYIVGGAVRDQLLKREVKDYDVVTEASECEVEALFPKAIRASHRFPIYIVRWENCLFEVTPFRTGAATLLEDLSKRDFTMNSIAMDKNGEVIDPLHGIHDLERQRIKAHDPEKVFTDDPLRILRAFRFQSEFGYTIERNTWKALIQRLTRLQEVAKERIHAEVGKLLLGEYHKTALTQFEEANVASFLPEMMTISSLSSISTTWNLSQLQSEQSRWAAFFLRMYGNQAIDKTSAWRFSNDQKRNVQSILKTVLTYSEEEIPWGQYMVYKLGEAALDAEAVHQWLHNMENTNRITDVKHALSQLPIRNKRDMAVDGRDIINHFDFIKKDKIGHLLDCAEKAVVQGIVKNEKTALLKYLKENCEHEK